MDICCQAVAEWRFQFQGGYPGDSPQSIPPKRGRPMKNQLKQLLAAGKPAIGSWISFSDPYAVELMADVGFDWLLIDLEHIPVGKETLRTILMACKGSASAPVVRVAVNSLDSIQTALDLGAQGVMTPMINCAEDAKQAVAYSRYPPLGRRGYGPIRASRYFQDAEQYRREANDETVVFVQIETPEAVQNAREILETPGIDGAFIGNGDLANFIAHSHTGSEEVQETVDRLIEMAGKISLPIGLPTWSQEECSRYVQRGAQLLTLGSDMSFLGNEARGTLAKVRTSLETARQGQVRS
jgi:2-keto-3-deoxy-L-rhamnonate aldolase RhmA